MNFTFGEKYHRWLYFIGLMGIAAGLSISKVLISIGVIWIGVNWIWEGGYAAKWRLLLARKSVLILISIFLLHLIGLLWTPDMNEGLRDVRIKLPLLVIPLVVGTSAPLSRKQLETILILFSIGVLIASIRTYLIVVGIIPKKMIDIRQASDLVPLIRLALFSAMTIMLCGRWFIRNTQWFIRVACLLTTAWLIYFMVYMQSLTGLVVLLGSISIIAVIMSVLNRKRKVLIAMVAVVLLGVVFAGRYVMRAYNDFYALRGNEVPVLYAVSPTGYPYEHHIDQPMYENGNKVMANVCWVDLMVEWNKRSDVAFHGGRDRKGNYIPYTIVRYLASKGLMKDSVGMSNLTNEEIREIENGVTNYKDKERNPLERRAYQVFWETYNYFAGGNPSGSSITMRFVVVGTAINTIKAHPWIGTGTGGQTIAYNKYYSEQGTELTEKWQWLHAHNQFLSIAVTLGIPAALFFIFSLWWPARTMRRWKSYLYLAFFVIVVLSFLDDDTLETQQGATFYAFFNALLLYAMPFVSSVPTMKQETTSVETGDVQN
jgi:hypothetical protein